MIIEAKRFNYNKQILISQSRIKTTWDIIKYETGQRKDSPTINNSQIDSETFNKYFLRIAERITQNVSNNGNIKVNNIQNSIQMMTEIFGKPFPKIRLTNTITNELEKMITSLQSKNLYGYDEVSTKI